MLILFICTLALILSWMCYRKCFYSPKKGRCDPYDPMKGEQYEPVAETLYHIISIMERYPWEDVAIETVDGIPLRGRYYHLFDGAPLLILCHGYRSNALRDCCGAHMLARKLGYNALVIHQRAHGESGGKTITFGIREREDVVMWTEYARQRFGAETPIVLFGLSMGAATVLMGCAEGYPDNVRGIIADSPYSSPADIIKKVCKDEGYPPFLYVFTALGARIFGGFRLHSCTALESVRHSQIPILLIHGEDDRMVPCDMSRKIANACPARCSILTIPGAGHGLGYMTDPPAYERAVTEFLRSCIENGKM